MKEFEKILFLNFRKQILCKFSILYEKFIFFVNAVLVSTTSITYLKIFLKISPTILIVNIPGVKSKLK